MPSYKSLGTVWLALSLLPATAHALPPDDTRPTAFLHVNVVPMDEERVLRDQTVVVSGGRITAIGPSATTPAPRGARSIEAAGQYLSPGLADMHVHLYAPQELTLYLASGVTTVFNLDGRPAHLSWRRRVSAGDLSGPTIYSAGPMFNRPLTAKEAVLEVDRQSAAGYDAVKIYNQVGAAEYPALAAEARKKDLVLVGHIAREPGFEATLSAGQSIAHAEEYVYTFFNDDPDPGNEVVHPLDTMKIPKAVAMTRESGVSVIPTLVAFHNIVRQATALPEYLQDPHLRYLAPFQREQLEADRNTYANRFEPDRLPGLAVSYEFQRQLVRALRAGGVPILAGTDASWLGVPGYSLHEEIENFQELGFTPYAALKTATVDAAKLLRRDQEFGTIAVGKRADLILTSKNPLEDSRNLRGIVGVMANGQWMGDAERRRRLQTLPASYRETLSRLLRLAASDLPALDAYLESNDPLGAQSMAVLSRLVLERGAGQVVETLERLDEVHPGSPLLAEEAINQLGYDLVGRKQTEAAIEIFRLNTRLYPQSGNACDSLAETYFGIGNKELARLYYARAIEVQPGYPNARTAREILETKLK